MDPGGVYDGQTKSDIELQKFQLEFQEASHAIQIPFHASHPEKEARQNTS